MITLTEIEVEGKCAAGRFRGQFSFGQGLQVISARNSYGKSLAFKAVAWCLGAEAIFGRPSDDPSFFPRAAREEIDLEGAPRQRVISSSCTIGIQRGDGATLRLSRDIVGTPSQVRVQEVSKGAERNVVLNARRDTMQDEVGGLQRFLFEWLDWPRKSVTTYSNGRSDVYLENLLPLFYVEQNHGWSNIQATQVTRYRQQQIDEVAVEYLLGAVDAIDRRYARNRMRLKEAELKERAKQIAAAVQTLFLKEGWSVEWSGEGTLKQIEARWAARNLRELLLASTGVDPKKDRGTLVEQLVALRRKLTSDPLDGDVISAPAGASQRAIELKGKRHALNDELRTLRIQQSEATELLGSLEHRLHAAKDVYRFKTTGVGRLTVMECPTCHRDIDLKTFQLETQSQEAVSGHIAALERDRDLIRKNQDSLAEALARTRAEAERVQADLQDAERALENVNAAVGASREQLAEVAGRIARTERAINRVDEAEKTLDELQDRITHWLMEIGELREFDSAPSDLERRVEAFTASLRAFLIAFGHSAVSSANAHAVRLSERYEPYRDEVELKAMGSASDVPRLIAAYSLALATASLDVEGLHPGIVFLDEPLQQNPDDDHRRLFLDSLIQQHKRPSGTYQTIIFTSLYPAELTLLRNAKFPVQAPLGTNFLRLVKDGSAGLQAGPTNI